MKKRASFKIYLQMIKKNIDFFLPSSTTPAPLNDDGRRTDSRCWTHM